MAPRRRPRLPLRCLRRPASGTRPWPMTLRWTPPAACSSRRCATRSRRTSPPGGDRGSRRTRRPPSTPCPPISPPCACSSTPVRGRWACSTTFEAVPIPSDASPAAGPDAHMTVWQPSTDHLWEFFQARKLADGWHANFGRRDVERVTLARLLRHGILARALADMVGLDRHEPAGDRRHDDDQRAQDRRHPACPGHEHPVGEARERTRGRRSARTAPAAIPMRSPRARASVSIPNSTSTASTCRR